MAKKSAKHHGGTPAIDALESARIPFTTHEYEHDGGTHDFGRESAAKLGFPPEQMYKTLIADAGGHLVVAVVPVSGHLDLKALAKSEGTKKAQLAPHEDAERSSGYVVGGISPLGQRTKLATFIDQGAQDYPVVYVSGGKRGLTLGVAPGDLADVTGAVFAPIAADGPAPR